MILSCQFFIVYGGMQIARSWTQFTGIAPNFTSKVEKALLTATASMNFAPMLAVLFIAARMRALNMDPINGNPQKWAQKLFLHVHVCSSRPDLLLSRCAIGPAR
jgi:hypothetical protein